MRYKQIGRNNYKGVLIEEIFANRKVNMEEFCNPKMPQPHDFKNMQLATEIILKHIEEKSKIAILQDCDIDGITSTTMMYKRLKEIDPEANISIVFHEKKTHGISMRELKDVIEGLGLLIVPDAGSEDFKEHKQLKKMGIDVVIIDHHDCKGKRSKDAVVVNNILDNKYTSLSGQEWYICFVNQ